MNGNPDQPLSVAVVDGELVIRIGIDVLKHAAERCPLLSDGEEHPEDKYATVLSAIELAHDVTRALLHEEEDGSSPISDVIDRAIVDAFEDGSEAFDYGDSTP